MDWPRLRRDAMRAEKGAPKVARAAIKQIVEGGAVTIKVAQLDKTWGRRRGQWVAWVVECGEDEYGFCAMGESSHMAMLRLTHAFHRVIHVCTKHPHLIKTAYRTAGWAWSDETKDKT